MITIEITTSDGTAWTEPYPGTADQARSEMLGEVVEEGSDPVTIAKVERVDLPVK